MSVCVKCGPVAPAANPRLAETCPRCGREMLTPRVTELHRAGNLDYGHHPWKDMERDIEFERRFTQEAARIAGCDVSALMAFAEERALPGPIRNMNERSMPVEIREELADSRNYASWEATRIVKAGDSEGLPKLGKALALIALAWHVLDEYERGV